LATLLTTQLSGCGQTGPLYLPKPPAKPASANVPPKAEASTALPSTAPVPQQ
jgi:predicted small lipoprotein YifL